MIKKAKVGHRLSWKPCGNEPLAQVVTPVACGSDVRGEVSGKGQAPSLRAAANRWLAAKNYLVQPLRNSTYLGSLAVIAHCSYCQSCTTSWCFTVRTEDTVNGELHGDAEACVTEEWLFVERS